MQTVLSEPYEEKKKKRDESNRPWLLICNTVVLTLCLGAILLTIFLGLFFPLNGLRNFALYAFGIFPLGGGLVSIVCTLSMYRATRHKVLIVSQTLIMVALFLSSSLGPILGATLSFIGCTFCRDIVR
jgi:hypothetical protein